MKTLYIVRHAKAEWIEPGISDEMRPLTEKGHIKTNLVTTFLKDHVDKIDLMISSHAVRAQETARIIAKSMDYPMHKIRIEELVYHADYEKLTELIFNLPEEITSVMIVGHNPTLTNLANHFMADKTDWLPTSAIAAIRFNTEKWEKIELAGKETVFLVTPKMLKQE